MGLFGNLFTESETKRDVEKVIENDTTLRNEIANINKNISSQVSNMMMESMQDMAAGQTITQEIKIKGIVSSGDVDISNIKQKAKVKVNLSALQNTELQNEMLEKIQNNMSQGIKEAISNVQSKENIEGEQWVSELAGFANNLVNNIAGGDLDETIKEKTSNVLNSENIQKNVNEVEANVESNISNKTMAKIAADFQADQGIEISDVAAGGNVTIANVDQEAISEQILKSVQGSGAVSDMVSDVLGLSKTFTEKLVSSEQVDKNEKKSTLSGIGDIFQGPGGIIVGIVSMVFSSIVGVGAFFMMQQQTGGSKKMLSKWNKLLKSLKLNKKNIIYLLLLFCAVVVLFYFLKKVKENFKETKKILMKHKGKYIFTKDNQMYLTDKKENAKKFDINVTEFADKPNTVLIQSGGKYARKIDQQIYLQDYELFDKEKHNFHIKKLSDDSFELYRGDENVVINDKGLLTLSKKDRTRFIVNLE